MLISCWKEDHTGFPVEDFGEMEIEELRKFLIENGYVGDGWPDQPEFAFDDEEDLDYMLDDLAEGIIESHGITIEYPNGGLCVIRFKTVEG